MKSLDNELEFGDEYEVDREDNRSALDQLDFEHYLRMLRKHKVPIVLFTAVVTALAAYYAYTATPIYRATSTLLIESQENNPISFEQLVGAETETGEYYQTQYELLKSRALANRVVNALDLWEHPEFNGTAVLGSDSGAQTDVAPGSGVGVSTRLQEGLSHAISSVRRLLGIEDKNTPNTNTDDQRPDSATVTDNLANISSNGNTNGRFGNTASGVSESFSERANGTAYTLSLDSNLIGGDARLSETKQRAVSRFMNSLTITPVRRTKLVKISFESEDPALAALGANTVGEQYIDSYLDAQLELTTKASTWLNQRLADLKTTLDRSEDALFQFKQDNNLVDVGGSVGRLNEQELLLVTSELAAARSDLSSKENMYREVQSLQGNSELLGALPTFQSDSLIQRVKIEQGQAQRNLDELRNRYGDRHPRIIDALSQLESLNQTLEGHFARVVGSTAKDVQLAQQKVSAIQAKLNAGKSDIQQIGSKEFELKALEREVDTNRAIYDTFFSRISEAKSADGLEAANARLSDYALAPRGPFKPKKQLIIALAALGALVLSVLMAFLYEQMDQTVKSAFDVESKVGLKLLGILPLVKSGFFARNTDIPLSPLAIPEENKTFQESVNTIRTAICLDNDKKTTKIITITSSVPSEGKSTVALNLAYSLSRMEKVLLIDADMRKPTVAKVAGYNRDVPGLGNLIAQTTSARNCIIRGVFEGSFDILPSGPNVEQPLELLSSRRFEKLLEKLGQYYDRIVIDSAPAQVVSDALVLSKLSDAVVYAVKSHETSMDLVKRGIDRLRQVKAPLVGVVITQVDVQKLAAYGGDYYYQGYYDYYGYSDKGSEGAGRLRLSQSELMEIRTDDSDMELDLEFDPLFNDDNTDGRKRSTDGKRNSVDEDEFDLTTKLDFV